MANVATKIITMLTNGAKAIQVKGIGYVVTPGGRTRGRRRRKRMQKTAD